MAKHKTKEEWISIFHEFEKDSWSWEEYYHTNVIFSDVFIKESIKKKKNSARKRFKNKYKEWKLLDNSFMEKETKTKGRKKKWDIEEVISELTDQEKDDIVRRYLEVTIKEDKQKRKKEACSFLWTNTKRAKIFDIHRTTFYKECKQRKYYFDFAKTEIMKAFYEYKEIFGSERLSVILKKRNIKISPRTLRNYMNRWGLITKTRVAKRRSESKNTKVKYKDLVKRNFNPIKDNILSTDVSYIRANEPQNHVYLSIVISNKAKMIEAYELSKSNDDMLVINTYKKLRRKKKFIIHSDHGSQYSSKDVSILVRKMNAKISMGRVGNSLDNREAEYFFGCLKGEYLNHIPTYKMTFNEIRNHIDQYIIWYNEKRIQKRLQWKAPIQISAYAI